MKKIILVAALHTFFVALIFAQADRIAGYWLTANGDSQVQIYRGSNGKFYGKIVWLEKDQHATDDKNPDTKLRNRSILGMQLLNGFTYNEKEKEWADGTIYDPESGNTYSCFMKIENDSILKVKGYVLGMRLFSRQTIWKREKTIRK